MKAISHVHFGEQTVNSTQENSQLYICHVQPQTEERLNPNCVKKLKVEKEVSWFWGMFSAAGVNKYPPIFQFSTIFMQDSRMGTVTQQQAVH